MDTVLKIVIAVLAGLWAVRLMLDGLGLLFSYRLILTRILGSLFFGFGGLILYICVRLLLSVL